MVKDTGRPELALAEIAKGKSPTEWSEIAGKVMV